MKNKSTIVLISIFLCFVAATACQKAEVDVPAPFEQMINSRSAAEPMRSFDSMEDFYAEVKAIIDLSPADLGKWLESQVNFVSQWSFMKEVNAEMAPVKSWDEALAVMKKYEGMYIFNPNEADLDGEPYCPVSKKAYSYLLNKFGDVRIADEVVNLNDLETFDDIVRADPITRAWDYDSNAVNVVQHQSGKARYRVESNIVDIPTVGYVHDLTVRHQYKEWFVWIGGPTYWHLYCSYYSWPGVELPKGTPEGVDVWSPRVKTGHTIFLARGEGFPQSNQITATIAVETTSLREQKILRINHKIR